MVSDATIYVIGLAESFESSTLHVTALSSESGEPIASINIPSDIANGPGDFFSLTQGVMQNPHLVWLDKRVIKHVALTPKLTNKPNSISGATYVHITNLGLCDKGYFVARKADGASYVFNLVGTKVQQIWEFTESVSLPYVNKPMFVHHSQANSEGHTWSLYAGGLDKDGNPYIGRLYWSHMHQV